MRISGMSGVPEIRIMLSLALASHAADPNL
jgi:hypothetical protein